MNANNTDYKRPIGVVSRDAALTAGTTVRSATDLGTMLRSRRKRLGYTQEQVAEMMGCSPRLVSEMERGRGTVGFNRMLAYATGLGIDLAAFER